VQVLVSLVCCLFLCQHLVLRYLRLYGLHVFFPLLCLGVKLEDVALVSDSLAHSVLRFCLFLCDLLLVSLRLLLFVMES